MWCASILYSEVTEIIQELITLKDSGVRLLEYQLDKNDRWLQIGRELHFLVFYLHVKVLLMEEITSLCHLHISSEL